MVTTWTLPQLQAAIPPGSWDTVRRWIERGDGVACYENHDLGHPNLGHRQFVSYGGPSAQLEAPEPPERLPDIGTAINWRYRLVATYHP